MSELVIRRIARGLATIALALTVAGCGATASPMPSVDALAGVEVVIAQGVSPNLRPEQVAALVIQQIHGMEQLADVILKAPRILRMTATTTAGAGQLEPGAGQPGQPKLDIEWLVRAEGTFATNRGRGAPRIADTGYFLLSDTDGGIIGFGFP